MNDFQFRPQGLPVHETWPNLRNKPALCLLNRSASPLAPRSHADTENIKQDGVVRSAGLLGEVECSWRLHQGASQRVRRAPGMSGRSETQRLWQALHSWDCLLNLAFENHIMIKASQPKEER